MGGTQPHKLLPLAAVVCVLVLAACGAPGSGDSDSASGSVTVTDSDERELTIDTPVRRVAVLDTGSAAVMRALGVEDRLVGSHQALRDDPLWDDIDDVPVVATYSETSYETLAEVDPDVVFSSLRAHGVVTDNEILDGFDISDVKVSLRRPELMTQEIEMMGAIFDAQERASELVDFYEETEAAIADRIDDVPDGERPNVFVEFHAGDFHTGGPGSRFYEQIERAGGRNIAADIDDEKQVGPEWVAEQDPDVIIREGAELGPGVTDTEEAEEMRDEVRHRAGIEQTAAATSGNVYVVPIDAYSRPGYIIGVAHIAQWLYPDRFDDTFVQQVEDRYAELMYPDIEVPDGVWAYPRDSQRD